MGEVTTTRHETSLRSHRRSVAAGVVGLVLLTLAVEGQAPRSLTPQSVEPKGVRVESARHDGREALRVIEADASRTGLGLAIVKDVTFRDGVIEVDVAGRRGPYAAPDDRGFIGIAFHVNAAVDRFEYIYLRPENGRANDQVRRNHSAQYSAHPDFPWPRMRKEFPEKYESYVDLEPGVWTRTRIEVSGAAARLFVHDAKQPTLVVNDLKHGGGEGGIGLFIGPGTEGFFSNLRIRDR
jgi:hypothetical protein